jgi:hypothetical protein
VSYWRLFVRWWTPIRIGIGLTLAVIVLFFAMALSEDCVLLASSALECRLKYEWFLDSSPNEIGDTLAGFSGTLAFIWLVVTVWLQSDELAEQREVLREQKEEFKLMVAAQNAQVVALQLQADISRDEMQRRDEAAEAQFIDERIDTVSMRFNSKFLMSSVWKFEKFHDGSRKSLSAVELQTFLGLQNRDTPIKVFLPRLPEALENCKRTLLDRLRHNERLVECPDFDIFFEALELSDDLPMHIGRLRSGSAERFLRLRLDELVYQLRDYTHSNELWDLSE